MKEIVLRDYQEKVIHDLRNVYRQGAQSPIVVMATGAGKTYTACYMCKSAVARGNRVLILVHKDDLIRQFSKSLADVGIPHGIISPNFTPDFFAPVQVASVFSLKPEMFEAFDFIIIDECHHGTAGSWRKAVNLYPTARRLGLTASPQRTDEQGLGIEYGGIFDCIVEGPQLRELMDRGVLCDYQYYAPTNIDQGQRAAGALHWWLQICPGVPTIGFCVDIEDAKRLAQAWRDAGFRAEHIEGKMDSDYRAELLQKLATGEIHLLASCLTITEGTDVPEVQCAILMKHSQSLSYFMQATGRLFRKSPGKEWAYVIDLVNLVGTHGLPCDERHWSLDGKSTGGSNNGAGAKKIRTCDSCFRPFYMPQSRRCPHCGFEQPLNSKEIKEIEAELVRIEREAKRKKEEEEKWEKVRERANTDTLEGLLEIEKKKGYKFGWAQRVWEARKKKQKAENKGDLFNL